MLSDAKNGDHGREAVSAEYVCISEMHLQIDEMSLSLSKALVDRGES